MVTLKLDHSLTLRHSVRFKESVGKALQDHDIIELDMSHVNQIDVSAINFMIAIAKKLKKRGGKIVMKDIMPDIRDILCVAQLDQFVEMSGPGAT